ncbi:MAG: L-2-amino-thiazoline-4-carboxylic acid hydrolase [Bacillota bacterium]
MPEAVDPQVETLTRSLRTLIWIAHDFFHCWRRAVQEKYGEEAAAGLTERFWQLVGRRTGELYLTKGGVSPGDIGAIVRAIARSSEIMGETVRVEQDGSDWLLIHDDCPWVASYREYGAPGQCVPGCHVWFAATLAAAAPEYTVTTESSLAKGDAACIRRFRRAEAR